MAARAAQQRVELADGEAPVRDARQLVVVRHRLEVVLAREQLLLHLLRAPRGAHAGDDLGRRRVLAEDVVGAVLERIEGRRHVARLADDDDRDAEEVGVALDLGHRAAEGGVQEQDVGALRARGAEHLVARRGLGDDRAEPFEHLAHRFASALRRVRDEHPRPRQRAVRGHCAHDAQNPVVHAWPGDFGRDYDRRRAFDTSSAARSPERTAPSM